MILNEDVDPTYALQRNFMLVDFVMFFLCPA